MFPWIFFLGQLEDLGRWEKKKKKKTCKHDLADFEAILFHIYHFVDASFDNADNFARYEAMALQKKKKKKAASVGVFIIKILSITDPYYLDEPSSCTFPLGPDRAS